MMEWNPQAMATGVELVDNQHQEIIRRVNKLAEKINDSESEIEPDVELLIDFLADYAVVHFRSEEGLQLEVDYPGSKEHFAEHKGFIDRFNSMRDGFFSTGVTSKNIKVLTDMTESWLIEHIAGSDAKFAAFYRDAKQKTDK